MAVGDEDEEPLEGVLVDRNEGPAPLSVEDAVGMFKAWLTDHQGAENARFVCRVEGAAIIVTHQERTTFRAG